MDYSYYTRQFLKKVSEAISKLPKGTPIDFDAIYNDIAKRNGWILDSSYYILDINKSNKIDERRTRILQAHLKKYKENKKLRGKTVSYREMTEAAFKIIKESDKPGLILMVNVEVVGFAKDKKNNKTKVKAKSDKKNKKIDVDKKEIKKSKKEKKEKKKKSDK